MYYNDVSGEKLSGLGLGCMRLPQLADGSIDDAQVFEMVKLAADGGINYYDTAYPYHNCMSEIVMGKALKQLPRESFYLATKFPGHQISASYDPQAVFEEQLKKCGVEYFDYYLLHNVCENSYDTYMSPKWGIIDYFIGQRKAGRIKHLGFSSHAMLPTLQKFVEAYGNEMEFCQIQLNFLDWTLQGAKAKYVYLTDKGIPVWVMEPLRGGKLVGDRELAFRFLQSLSNVKMILSGMSSLEQLGQNIDTFASRHELTPADTAYLMEKAERMKDSIPCTDCRYCCEACPMGLDIPVLISMYNDMRFSSNFNIAMTIEALDDDKKPSACIGCGQCREVCPQKIDIHEALSDFADRLKAIPPWAVTSRQREEAARKLRSSTNG